MQTLAGRSHDAILIGDSHAAHLFDGINEYYKTQGKNLLLLGQGGCLPFYDVETGDIVSNGACMTKMQEGLDYAITHDSIKTVILSSRGPMYITGHDFSEVERENHYIKLMNKPDVTSYSDVFSIGMRRTLAILTHAHKKVVFL